MNANTDDLIIRFLLGELSDEERAKVEERFLADNEFFEAALSAEDDLLDRYLLGQLSAEQRRRAERLFQSSPRQRREVSFTEELLASLRGPDRKGDTTADSDSEDHDRSLPLPPTGIKNFTQSFNWAAGLALLLVCLALVSLFLYRYSQRPPPPSVAEKNNPETHEKPSEEDRGKAETHETPEVTPEEDATPEEVVVPQPKRQPAAAASILLSPTAHGRGGASNTVRIKAGMRRVKLQLELDEGPRYDRYSVLVTTFEGRKVWSRDALDAGQIKKGRLTLVLPSSSLMYNDYRVELKGLPDGGEPVHVADYVFKVRD